MNKDLICGVCLQPVTKLQDGFAHLLKNKGVLIGVIPEHYSCDKLITSFERMNLSILSKMLCGREELYKHSVDMRRDNFYEIAHDAVALLESVELYKDGLHIHKHTEEMKA